ncbi:MAG: hypothetical protein COA86_08605 [Kangiella sp.]|nr:MAG: hypothetical protein COA86_08605 [Kangiella sp.]
MGNSTDNQSDILNEKLEDEIEDIVEDELEEKIAELKLSSKQPPPSFWKKMQTGIMMVAALMISAGQFNDTKEIFTSSYEGILANFTNNIEYELIEKIHVGSSIEHIKSLVGEPHAIKRSKLNDAVRFFYYSKGKYNLTLIASEERLVGYSIYTQEDEFAPQLPFSESHDTEPLGSKNLLESHKKTGVYSYDIGNLVYYIESQNLGKQQMFLTLIRGYVEYGAIPNVEVADIDNKAKLAKQIALLDEKATFSESEEELEQVLNQVRKLVYPNFYAVTELEPAIISEALLTRYEYQMFTNS